MIWLNIYKRKLSRGMYSMNEELLINADECYRLAEEKALHYFKILNYLSRKRPMSPF